MHHFREAVDDHQDCIIALTVRQLRDKISGDDLPWIHGDLIRRQFSTWFCGIDLCALAVLAPFDIVKDILVKTFEPKCPLDYFLRFPLSGMSYHCGIVTRLQNLNSTFLRYPHLSIFHQYFAFVLCPSCKHTRLTFVSI